MPRSRAFLLILSLNAAGLGGCATSESPTALATRTTKPAEAPLGSRIRRSTAVAPTSGVTREEIEQSKAQTAAIRAGVVNDGGR